MTRVSLAQSDFLTQFELKSGRFCIKVYGKWGLTGPSKRLKVDGHVLNSTVQKTKIRRSVKVNGPEIKMWTVKKQHLGYVKR